MLTISVLALLFGACLLLACATAVLLKAGELRGRRIVERTPPIPLGDVRGGASRVAVVGTTAHGPGGPVVAPVSGVECAWFMVRLTRSPSRRRDEDGGEDLLLQLSSPTPPALTDRSGVVLLDPRLLAEPPNPHDPVATEQVLRLLNRGSAADWPSLIPHGLLEDTRDHESVQLRETRLPVGREVYALGGTSRGVPITLQPTGRGGLTTLTTDDVAAVLRRLRAQATSSGQLIRALGVAGVVVTLVSAVAVRLLVRGG